MPVKTKKSNDTDETRPVPSSPSKKSSSISDIPEGCISSPPSKSSYKNRKDPHTTPVKKHGIILSDSKEDNQKGKEFLDAIESTGEAIIKEELNPDQPTQSSPRPFHSSSISILPRVSRVYNIVKKATGALGGNGYDGAIYGELTKHSMQKIVDFLIKECELTTKSMFIDVGSGLGKPNFHVAQSPGVRISLGIELEEIRWKLAMHNLHKFMQELLAQTASTATTTTAAEEESDTKMLGGVNFICGDIEKAESLDPFSHIYMYDLGFPPDLQRKIAQKFNDSIHARYLVSYRPAHRVIGEEYGYEVELVGQLPTSMHGSGEIHTAYFYKRLFPDGAEPIINRSSIPRGTKILSIPARREQIAEGEANDGEQEVVCSEIFYKAVQLAAGPPQDLADFAQNEVESHLSSGRPKRERRQRVI